MKKQDDFILGDFYISVDPDIKKTFNYKMPSPITNNINDRLINTFLCFFEKKTLNIEGLFDTLNDDLKRSIFSFGKFNAIHPVHFYTRVGDDDGDLNDFDWDKGITFVLGDRHTDDANGVTIRHAVLSLLFNGLSASKESDPRRKINVNKVIILGDYFDSFTGPTVNIDRGLDVLKYWISLAKVFEGRVKLLIGNHDLAYLMEDKAVSGHDRDPETCAEIKKLFEDYLDLFDVVHVEKNLLCSHAGISNKWADDVKRALNKPITPELINDLFHQKNYEYIKFQKKIDSFNSPYGDNTWQGPLWIRPKSLQKSGNPEFAKNMDQVIGHTEQTIPTRMRVNSYPTDTFIYLIDTFERDGLIGFMERKSDGQLVPWCGLNLGGMVGSMDSNNAVNVEGNICI